jgi:hypothetical protein
MPSVDALQGWDNRLIRKHPLQICAMADYDADAPSEFFDSTDHLPTALPDGYHDLGYITTDGIPWSRDVDTDDVDSVQTTEHTRSDISSDVLSAKIMFQETTGLTLALGYGTLLANAPALGETVDMKRPAAADQPYRRMLVITQDGTGDQAFYRVMFCPRVRITDFDDRNFQRSDEEQHAFTFTAYYDAEYGTSLREIMDGPGWQALGSGSGSGSGSG